jgi:hypothetical protein
MVDAVPHSHDERGNSDHDHPEAYNYTRIVISVRSRAAKERCISSWMKVVMQFSRTSMVYSGVAKVIDHGSRDTDH